MRAVQYHPRYCAQAKAADEAARKRARAIYDWDTSHDLSLISEDGRRIKVGTFKHAAWASSIGALIVKNTVEADWFPPAP